MAGTNLALLTEAVELEGSFGIVVGNLDGDTLYDAKVEEVVPPILSGVLDRLLKQGALELKDRKIRSKKDGDRGANVLTPR